METPQLRDSDQTGRQALREWPVWKQIVGVWRPVYGGFASHGVSIEWHDFRLSDPLPWSQSFHSNSLEICLNYSGQAELHRGSRAIKLGVGQLAVYTTRDQLPLATRGADSLHRFLTLEFSPDYLSSQFASFFDGLLPGVRRFIDRPERFDPWLEVRPLISTLYAMRIHLLEPPVNSAALTPWYQGKILEIMAQILFRPDKPAEMFCHRHKRLNKERIERAKYILERDLANPPSLAMLSKELDCSSFYLSRMFADEAGVSLPKYLRLKRIEKATELIKEHGISVTDAAVEVGYSSLSAFHKAFVETHGVSPGNYRGQAGIALR